MRQEPELSTTTGADLLTKLTALELVSLILGLIRAHLHEGHAASVVSEASRFWRNPEKNPDKAVIYGSEARLKTLLRSSSRPETWARADHTAVVLGTATRLECGGETAS